MEYVKTSAQKEMFYHLGYPNMNPESKRGLLRAKNEAEESREWEQKERRHYSRVVPREGERGEMGRRLRGQTYMTLCTLGPQKSH